VDQEKKMLTSISTNNSHSLKIQKTFNATIDKVYKAWTEPAKISKWFGRGMVSNIQVTQDLSVGGRYRFEMTTGPDGAVTTIDGIFQQIIPNKKLVYTWNSDSAMYPAADTLVTVEFIDRGNATDIVLEHTNFAFEKFVEGHAVGWTAGFDKLSEFLSDA
jgi:uncharacterized protein YndB with AHSA1/START domain